MKGRAVALAGLTLVDAVQMATLGPALWLWPDTNPGPGAWAAVGVLALACTGLAYILFFRLIAHVGPAQAIAVTYLIPVFAIGWGVLFLGESGTPTLLIGGAIVLLGTALATGFIGGPKGR